MNSRSRSTLFLMEQLIVILVFAICAAVCVRIFAGAYSMANDSKDIRYSLVMAKSAAECFKAANGDILKAAEYLGAPSPDTPDAFEAYYDGRGKLSAANDAKYVLRVASISSPGMLKECCITVRKQNGGEILKFASGVVHR